VKPDRRPLVTFALFAYNQEAYIREAVEGAFAQTYEPLEIILSDDCSSDRTYEIMREMAAAYDGPHEVRAVQTDRNIGVSSHVFLRGKEAKGQIVVVAAGDDISKPDRCAVHLGVYRDQNVMGVSGAFDLIDASGKLLSADCKQPIASSAYERQRGLFLKLDRPYVVIQGSTASYRRDVFEFGLPNWHLEFSEDNLFNFIIYAHGFRVVHIDKSLVEYRQHDTALSNRASVIKSVSDREVSSFEAALKEINKMDSFIWIAENSDKTGCINLSEINSRKEVSLAIKQWPTLTFLQRTISIMQSAKGLQFGALKWKAARLFGNFPNYQPKSLIHNLLRG
jgi:glycosyltransferase involved in cell wall biosynthesis